MSDRPGIPKSEDAVTVDWMQRALVAGGTCGVPALKDMAVEQIGTRSGFVGMLLRCHLTYHERAPAYAVGVRTLKSELHQAADTFDHRWRGDHVISLSV